MGNTMCAQTCKNWVMLNVCKIVKMVMLRVLKFTKNCYIYCTQNGYAKCVQTCKNCNIYCTQKRVMLNVCKLVKMGNA